MIRNYKFRVLKYQKKPSKKMILTIFLAVLLLISGIIFAIYKIFMVNEIVFVGCTHYNDEQLTEYIFKTKHPNSIVYKMVGDKDKVIPFIQKYDVEYNWPDKLYVTVYEKAIVGYVNYMGCRMYFDRDGIVVESSTDIYENTPEISGLKFDSIVLNSKLDVGDDKIFGQILDLTQSFDKYDLDIDRVYFDSSYNVILYMKDVKINLGSGDDFSDKLFELKQVEDKFGSLKGTLYLNEYNGNDNSIVFKREN